MPGVVPFSWTMNVEPLVSVRLPVARFAGFVVAGSPGLSVVPLVTLFIVTLPPIAPVPPSVAPLLTVTAPVAATLLPSTSSVPPLTVVAPV